MTARATNTEGRRARGASVLRKAVEFETVLRSGSRITSRNFVLRAYPNAVLHARLGIIAGKKAAERAVDRNRGKRLIREVFRVVSSSLGGHDLVVQLRNDLRTEPNEALRAELRRLMESAVRRCTRSQTQ